MKGEKAFVIGRTEELRVLVFAPLSCLGEEFGAQISHLLALTAPGHACSFYIYSDEQLARRVEELARDHAPQLRPVTACSEQFHIVFCFGGDGVLPKLNQFLRYHGEVPVVSLAPGPPGRFSEFGLADLPRLVRHVEELLAQRRGELSFALVSLRRLACNVLRRTVSESSYTALAEVHVKSPDHRPRAFHLFLDERPLMRLSCDALVVATPLGALERSCALRGPVLDFSSDFYVLNAAAPTGCVFRPVVLGRQHVLRLELDEHSHEKALVVFDGVEMDALDHGQSLEIRGSDSFLELVTLDLRANWSAGLRRAAANAF